MKGFITLITILTFSLTATPIHAAVVSPLTVDLNTPIDAENKSQSFEISVSNTSATEKRYTTTFQDFVSSADSPGVPQFLAPEERSVNSLIDWIILDQSSIILGPNEAGIISGTIQPSENAEPGTYFSSILFEETATTEEGDNISALIGSLIFYTITSDSEERATITDVHATKSLWSHLPVEISFTVDNQTNFAVEPWGFLRRYNFLGQDTIVATVNDLEAKTLPNSSRTYTVYWQKTEVPEDGSIITKQWKNFAFGPFGFELDLVDHYGEYKLGSHDTGIIWVIPWLVIVIALGICAMIGFIVHLSTRNQ